MNPFRIDGPAVVSFSGGRTSGMMLRRILDAHGGRLPADVHVVFANTGKEREETLRFVADCAERWGVVIRWVERDGLAPAGKRVREVGLAGASRNGEPFIRLIAEKQFLPNAVMRFCTHELKVEPMQDFMASLGYDEWVNVIGLRRDEASRVSKVRARDHGRWTPAFPLFQAKITAEDVAAFWCEQPFGLSLKSWEGNCDACYLKGIRHLVRIERDRPGTMAWWADREAAEGATFVRTHRYLDVIDRASMPALPGILDEERAALPCACTD